LARNPNAKTPNRKFDGTYLKIGMLLKINRTPFSYIASIPPHPSLRSSLRERAGVRG
jgi:hypothetical protein